MRDVAEPQRARALRDALLVFFYENRDIGNGNAPSPYAFSASPAAGPFDPPPREDELTGAARFLKDEGYIKGQQSMAGTFFTVSLTTRGIRAAEEGHLTGPRPTNPAVVNNLSISGYNSGPIAQGQAVQQAIGLAADDVAAILATIRKAIGDLGERDRSEAEVLAALLEEELAEDQPRSSKARRIATRLAVLLAESAAAGSIEALIAGLAN